MHQLINEKSHALKWTDTYRMRIELFKWTQKYCIDISTCTENKKWKSLWLKLKKLTD